MTTPTSPPSRRARNVRAVNAPRDGAGLAGSDGPIVAVEIHPAPPIQAAWRARPLLRGGPLAVAPPGGHITSACPAASRAGAVAGQSIAQARLLCPDLVVVPPDAAATSLLYDDALRALTALSPVVEAADPRVGMAYLDARGLALLWGEDLGGWDGRTLARGALHALADSGIGARGGAGPTRTLALALARRMGPEGPRALTGEAARVFLRALPLDDLALGLAPASALALRDLGVTTAGALAALPEPGVALRFGADVRAAWRVAGGRQEPPLRPWAPPERLTVARRIEGGTDDGTIVEAIVRALCAEIADQLGARCRATSALALYLECVDGTRPATGGRYWPPLRDPSILAAAALPLLAACRVAASVETIAMGATDLHAPQVVQRGLWGDDGDECAGEGGAARRRERLAGVLAARARHHGASPPRRWRPAPHTEDGWALDEMAPAERGPGL